MRYRFVTSEARIQCQGILYVICRSQTGSDAGFNMSAPFSPASYLSVTLHIRGHPATSIDHKNTVPLE